MEGSIRSCTKKRAACFSVGAFGTRWYDMAVANNVPADLFASELGQPTTVAMVDEALATGKYDLITVTHNETSTGIMNPVGEIGALLKEKYPDVVFCVDAVSSAAGYKIEVDAWGIDVCVTSTQKALGLPPGLAICTFSQKAYESAKQVEFRGFYLDLVKLYDTIQKKDYQYPSTPSLAHMNALDYQLECIMAEGLDQRFDRHQEMADVVRAWAEKNFALFAPEGYRSNTVTCIRNTKEIDVADLNKQLARRGYTISNGYGKMKGKTFRIAHMADYKIQDINDLLKEIDDILGL
jgi:aspartate aminotransferase-like enzyme